MKDHPNVERAELVAYLDGELPEERNVWWRTHLETCESCAGLADELKSLTGAIRNLPDNEVACDITIQLEDQKIIDLSAIHRRRERRWLPLALAASLAILVWSGYALWRSSITLRLTDTASLSGPMTDYSSGDVMHSRTEKVKNEFNYIHASLEAYYIDNNYHYPYPEDGAGAVIMPMSPGAPVAGFLPRVLTTPIQYILHLPKDPFDEALTRHLHSYRYATSATSCWILTSNGPDQMPDIDLNEIVKTTKAACNIAKALAQLGMGGTMREYDPTNGTTSGGDIFRTGP